MVVYNPDFSRNTVYCFLNRMKAELQKVLYIVVYDDDGKVRAIQNRGFVGLITQILNNFSIYKKYHPIQTSVYGRGIHAGWGICGCSGFSGSGRKVNLQCP